MVINLKNGECQLTKKLNNWLRNNLIYLRINTILVAENDSFFFVYCFKTYKNIKKIERFSN